jgi:hypothetical protein
MSQQLVPPPCTGGHAAWHCESDVQLPHVPPPLLLPDELPLLLPMLLPDELPLLLPLPELPPENPPPEPLPLLAPPELVPPLLVKPLSVPPSE